jgi:hypothetical protein
MMALAEATMGGGRLRPMKDSMVEEGFHGQTRDVQVVWMTRTQPLLGGKRGMQWKGTTSQARGDVCQAGARMLTWTEA